MFGIITQSLWRDEASSVLISQKPIQEMLPLIVKDAHLPLYFLILHFWIQLFGSGELSVRSLPFIFHILLVITVFFLAKKILRKNVMAFLVSLAVFLNPFLLTFAFEARMYSLLAFLTTLACLLFLNRLYGFLSVVMILILYTHPVGFLIFLSFALFVFFWAYFMKERVENKIVLTTFIVPFIFFLPWIVPLWHQVGSVLREFWVPKVTSKVFIETFQSFASGIFEFKNQSAIYNVSVLLSIIAISPFITKLEIFKDKTREVAFLAFVALFSVLGLFLFSWFGRSIYIDRLLISSIPLLIILISFSLTKVYQTTGDFLKGGIIVLVAIFFLYSFQAGRDVLESETKPSIGQTVQNVTTKIKEDDFVIVESPLNYLETKYYLEQFGKSYVPTFALTTNGRVPFYLGAALFDPLAPITQPPKDHRYWLIKTDGNYQLVEPEVK
jgi:uncharacterized membrane protein